MEHVVAGDAGVVEMRRDGTPDLEADLRLDRVEQGRRGLGPPRRVDGQQPVAVSDDEAVRGVDGTVVEARRQDVDPDAWANFAEGNAARRHVGSRGVATLDTGRVGAEARLASLGRRS